MNVTTIEKPITETEAKTQNSRSIEEHAQDLILLRHWRDTQDEDTLETLLKKHENLNYLIAWRMYTRYPYAGSLEDFLQHTRLGAITAYKRYNFEKGKNIKLSNFVHTTVTLYLIDAMNNDAFVHCPSAKRSMRSYLAGRYDNKPQKKKEFEEANGLDSEEAISKARHKYRGLKLDFVSLEDMYHAKHGTNTEDSEHVDFIDNSEGNIIARMDIEAMMKLLSSRQRTVCKLVMYQEYSNNEAAEILSEKLGKQVTEGMIRADLRRIREVAKRVLN